MLDKKENELSTTLCSLPHSTLCLLDVPPSRKKAVTINSLKPSQVDTLATLSLSSVLTLKIKWCHKFVWRSLLCGPGDDMQYSSLDAVFASLPLASLLLPCHWRDMSL